MEKPDNRQYKRTAEEIYSNVVGRPGTHKDLPLHINATGEYLRMDLVLATMHEYAAQELDDYKVRLKNHLAYEHESMHISWQQMIELIDKL